MAPSDVLPLATRQGGVVSRTQLLGLGWTRHEIQTRIANGWLVALYRGVYAVGHTALTDEGRVRAALLAAGLFAVASHWTAAALWRLIASLPVVLDVTLTAGDRRRRPGLRIHHGTPRTTRHRGLPVTTPLQTLADLGHPDDLVREALARRLIRPEDLPEPAAEPDHSRLERMMRALVRRAGLPQPVSQYRIGPYVVDFAWPEHGVLVETDGWGTHGRRRAFEDDRSRDAHLAAAGYVVLRFTWRQLEQHPLLVISRLSQVLARAERRAAS